jgi:hypothetical protein
VFHVCKITYIDFYAIFLSIYLGIYRTGFSYIWGLVGP